MFRTRLAILCLLIGVSLALAASPATVTLTWDYTDNPSGPAQGFKLYRRTVGTAYVLLATLPVSQRTFTDPNLPPGVQIFWQVTAYNTLSGVERESAPSNEFSLTGPIELPNSPGMTLRGVFNPATP